MKMNVKSVTREVKNKALPPAASLLGPKCSWYQGFRGSLPGRALGT